MMVSFRWTFQFIENEPPDLRRGQTLQAKLTLGDETEAVLIPNGSFYQDTGGNWIFVTNEDENSSDKAKHCNRQTKQFLHRSR